MRLIRTLAVLAALLAAGQAHAQTPLPPLGSLTTAALSNPPASIAANGSWTGPIIPLNFNANILAGVTGGTVGALSITLTRYVDNAGTQVFDVHSSPSGTFAWASAGTNDGLPCGSYNIVVSNGTASPVTVTALKSSYMRTSGPAPGP